MRSICIASVFHHHCHCQHERVLFIESSFRIQRRTIVLAFNECCLNWSEPTTRKTISHTMSCTRVIKDFLYALGSSSSWGGPFIFLYKWNENKFVKTWKCSLIYINKSQSIINSNLMHLLCKIFCKFANNFRNSYLKALIGNTISIFVCGSRMWTQSSMFVARPFYSERWM